MPLSIALSITACMLDSMDQDEKVRENRLRRMAERQGFRLTKTRRMDPLATDYGTWHLIPAKGKPLGPFSIDEAEERLTSPRRLSFPIREAPHRRRISVTTKNVPAL